MIETNQQEQNLKNFKFELKGFSVEDKGSQCFPEI